MRYVIGARVPNNDGSIADGLFVWGSFGLPYILTDKAIEKNNEDSKDKIIIFDSIEKVNDYIQELRNSYYREFHDRAARYNLNIGDFRFYPLKFDSSKMNHIKLGRRVSFKDKKQKIYYFKVVNS